MTGGFFLRRVRFRSSVVDSAGDKQPTLEPPVDGVGRPYLVTEAVGTLSGPARFYRRTDPQAVQQGQATAHGLEVSVPVRRLATGDYTVRWHVLSADDRQHRYAFGEP